MKKKKVLKISLFIITILCCIGLVAGCKYFNEQYEQSLLNQQNNPQRVEIDTTAFDY